MGAAFHPLASRYEHAERLNFAGVCRRAGGKDTARHFVNSAREERLGGRWSGPWLAEGHA